MTPGAGITPISTLGAGSRACGLGAGAISRANGMKPGAPTMPTSDSATISLPGRILSMLHGKGGKGMSVQAIAEALKLPLELVKAVVEMMIATGMLLALENGKVAAK